MFKLFLSTLLNGLILWFILIYMTIFMGVCGLKYFATIHLFNLFFLAFALESLLIIVAVNISKINRLNLVIKSTNLPSTVCYKVYLKIAKVIVLLTHVSRLFIPVVYLISMLFIPLIVLVYLSRIWLKI